jgi:hypothetical protein
MSFVVYFLFSFSYKLTHNVWIKLHEIEKNNFKIHFLDGLFRERISPSLLKPSVNNLGERFDYIKSLGDG